jgi:hypothetical protein
VPIGEAQPLAAALAELLAEPATAAAMGRAAHVNVLQEGRWSDVVGRLASQLEQNAGVSVGFDAA